MELLDLLRNSWRKWWGNWLQSCLSLSRICCTSWSPSWTPTPWWPTESLYVFMWLYSHALMLICSNAWLIFFRTSSWSFYREHKSSSFCLWCPSDLPNEPVCWRVCHHISKSLSQWLQSGLQLRWGSQLLHCGLGMYRSVLFLYKHILLYK